MTDRKTDAEQRARLDAMDPFQRSMAIVVSALMDADRITDRKERHKFIQAVLKVYRTELIGDFARYLHGNTDDTDDLVLATIHESEQRLSPAKQTMVDLIIRHFGETLQ